MALSSAKIFKFDRHKTLILVTLSCHLFARDSNYLAVWGVCTLRHSLLQSEIDAIIQACNSLLHSSRVTCILGRFSRTCKKEQGLLYGKLQNHLSRTVLARTSSRANIPKLSSNTESTGPRQVMRSWLKCSAVTRGPPELLALAQSQIPF